jgi:hypothetical protein
MCRWETYAPLLGVVVARLDSGAGLLRTTAAGLGELIESYGNRTVQTEIIHRNLKDTKNQAVDG